MLKKKGFTLIELLVVVAIIALLLSVVVPGMRKARQKAQAVICLSNLKQWGLLYTLYAQDNAASLPVGWNGGTMWMVDLMSYYQSVDDLRLCPRATRFLHDIPDNIPTEFTAWGKYGEPGYFSGWVPPWGERGQYGSYSVNAWSHNPLDIGVAGTYDTPVGTRGYYWRKLAITAKSPAAVPLMGDGMWDGEHPMETNPPPPEKGVQQTGNPMSTLCIDRHDGGTNWVFMDAGARAVGLKELWRLKWHTQWQDPRISQWPDWMSRYSDD